jgi:hypothetical protein
MKVVITIEVPDGAVVGVREEGTRAIAADEPEPYADQLIPYPDAIPIPGDPVVRGMAHGVVPTGLCPVHHVPWRTVPAGVSKRTGKAYDAFQACPERDCDQRPAAA